MIFRFYCDESYDGNPKNPDTLTISGFFSDQPTWEAVESKWDEINRRYGVSRFHATALNCATEEYVGWDKQKRNCYSAELLKSINCQKKKMCAYNCGMRANEYRNIISAAGRIKLGHPWIACFKSCIAMIAKDMETLPAKDRFSVFVEKGSEFDKQVGGMFEKLLAKNPAFAYRHRLMACTSSKPQKLIGLQVADLMAYEYFKRLKDRENKVEMRIPLKLIRKHNAYKEGFFGKKTLKRMKDEIESAECEHDQLVIIPHL